MFGLLNRVFGVRGATPSLDAIRFDTTGYAFAGEQVPGHLRVWNTPEGDQLGVHFFSVPPNLPADATSVADLAAVYRRLIEECEPGGGRLVEISVLTAGGCPAIRIIVSVPQQPSGRAYIGALTVPFRDFSFVLKSQVLERGPGPTGLKETILMMRRWKAEETPRSLTDDPPFDPDAPEHDSEFPGHPVARTRRVMAHVEATLMVVEAVRRLPAFALPR